MRNLLVMSLLVISGMLFAGTSVPITDVGNFEKEKVELTKSDLSNVSVAVESAMEVSFRAFEFSDSPERTHVSILMSNPLSVRSVSNAGPPNSLAMDNRIRNYTIDSDSNKEPPSIYEKGDNPRDWITDRWNC